MKLNLFTNWFDSHVRPEEFEFCRDRNIKIFDRVINLKGRPTFNEFFECMAKFPDDCNVVSNLDIFFDPTIHLAKNIIEDVAYCLTRKEWTGTEAVDFSEYNGGHPGEWSQDAWVFTGCKFLEVNAGFSLGIRGCDNHLAWLLMSHGFKISNPSLDINAIHYHHKDRTASTNRGEKVGDSNRYIKVTPEHIKMI